jgi:hypothetical protein
MTKGERRRLLKLEHTYKSLRGNMPVFLFNEFNNLKKKHDRETTRVDFWEISSMTRFSALEALAALMKYENKYLANPNYVITGELSPQWRQNGAVSYYTHPNTKQILMIVSGSFTMFDPIGIDTMEAEIIFEFLNSDRSNNASLN